MTETPARTKLTTRDILRRKGGPKLTMLAAYDFPTARLIEQAGIDMLLVGDSLGMNVLGYDSTVPVTLDDIIHHSRAVRRGAPSTHLVADLPFATYASDTQTVANGARLLQDGGADAVKLEGGRAMASRIAALVEAGIPVMGHIGLSPQRVGITGGYRVQGRDRDAALRVVDDAVAIAEAGAYAVVVELVPAEVAEALTERIPIPTIGIGAGAGCDGQVLVAGDLLGLDDRFTFSFVRRYAEIGAQMRAAFASWRADVEASLYPATGETFELKPATLAAVRNALERNGENQA